MKGIFGMFAEIFGVLSKPKSRVVRTVEDDVIPQKQKSESKGCKMGPAFYARRKLRKTQRRSRRVNRLWRASIR